MLKILGDINFSDGYFHIGSGIGTSIARGINPFANLERNSEDFWIGNFECVCANVEKTNHPFVISPDSLDNVKHLNLYGVANNHVMQAGDEAYQQTIDYLKRRNILFAGTDKCRSIKFEHQSKLVGFMAFSQRPDNFSSSPSYWHIPEYSEITAEIEKLDDCHFKIAYIHWGYEFMNYPNIDQKLLAHWLIDNGIDLVVGMHPHLSQGIEVYKDKYIFYSLGNSVFNMNWEPTRYGLLVSVDLSNGSVSVEHTVIDEIGSPKITKIVPKRFSIDYLNTLVGITEENEKYFAKAKKYYLQYRRVNRKSIILNLLNLSHQSRMMIIQDYINRRFK